jgi:hypothetical protein
MAGLTIDQLSSSFDSRLDNNSENLLLWSASFEAKLEALGLSPVNSGVNAFTASITASFTSLSSSVKTTSASFDTRIKGVNTDVNDLSILTNNNFNVVSNRLISLNAFSSSITASLTELSSSVSTTSASFNTRINSVQNTSTNAINSINATLDTSNSKIDNLNAFSASITASYVNFSGSQYKIDSSSFTTRINGEHTYNQLVFNNVGNSISVLESNVTSVNAFTASITSSFNTFSSSQYKADSGSFTTRINNLAISRVSAGTVSSSQQILDYNKFAVTASTNTFYDDQIISGNLYLPSLKITPPTLEIGDEYQGGEVAYIIPVGYPDYEAGKVKGLIISTTDIVADENWYGGWGNGGFNAGATSTSNGLGNTALIANNGINLVQNLAAIVYQTPTSGLVKRNINGYNDWYIPSSGEWQNTLYASYIADRKDQFDSSVYWTSTEYGVSALAFDIDSNALSVYGKTGILPTRIVRKFTQTLPDAYLKYNNTTNETELGDFENVNSNIIPAGNGRYNLGSVTNPWKDLFVSPNSIKVVGSDGSILSTISTNANGSQNFPYGVTTADNIFMGDAFEIGRRSSLTNAAYINTNIVMGTSVMNQDNHIGQHNIGIGQEAGYLLGAGSYNIMIGLQAGRQIGEGSSNVLIGQGAGNSMLKYGGVTPSYNTFLGSNAGQFITTGEKNVAVGNAALYSHFGSYNTLKNNTAIGYSAGTFAYNNSHNNIYLGAYAGPSVDTQETYKFYVSNGNSGSQAFMYGNMANDSRALDINAKLVVSGSITLIPQGAPATPASGSLYFSSGDSHFYGWNGIAWKQLDN